MYVCLLPVLVLLPLTVFPPFVIHRFKNSDALVKEVTLLVRLNPDCASHIPAAVEYLATAHSVEADAPEVTASLLLLLIIMLHFYRAISLTSLVIQRHTHINKNFNVNSITKKKFHRISDTELN